MFLEILKFVFSNFWIWLGTILILETICEIFKSMRSIHIHINDEELSKEDVKTILNKIK